MARLVGPERTILRRARAIVAEHDTQNPHAAGRVREAVGQLLVTGTRPGVWSHVPTMLFGLVFFGFSIPFLVIFTPDGDAATTGTITQVHRYDGDEGDTCSVSVDYVVDGRTYRTGSGFSSSSFCSKDVGGTVEVRYDAANPQDAEVDPGWVVWVIHLFPAVGALIFLPSLAGSLIALVAVATGRRMVRAGRRASTLRPASSADELLVAQVTERFTAEIAALRHTNEPVDADDLDEAPVPYYADAPVLAPGEIARGWYRTDDGTSERWHNGVEWTPHVRPYAPATVTPPPASGPGVPPTPTL